MERLRKEHPELGIKKCATNLGISKSALSNWTKIYTENEGAIPTRGRGNFESDEAKEMQRIHTSYKRNGAKLFEKGLSMG